MPRQIDHARRAELAAAAIEVIRVRGVQTSMSELADALGVKRPTLYFYFPDLGAVFDAVLDQMYRELAQAVVARMQEVAHPLERLRAAAEATLAFHRERPQLIHGLLQLWSLGGRDVKTVLERERKNLVVARDALVADLRAGIARGDVARCSPERIVDLVLAVVSGVLVHQVLGISRSDEVMSELVARVIDPCRPTAIHAAARQRSPVGPSRKSRR